MQVPAGVLGGGYPAQGFLPGGVESKPAPEQPGGGSAAGSEGARGVVFSTAPTAPTPALEPSTAVSAVSAPKFQEVDPAALDSNVKVAAQVMGLAGGLEAESAMLKSQGAAEAMRAGGVAALSEDEGDSMLLANDAMELRGLATGMRNESPAVAWDEKILAPDTDAAGAAAAEESSVPSWSSDYKGTIAEAEKQIAILDKLLASNPNPTALNSGAYQVAETLQKTFGQTVMG